MSHFTVVMAKQDSYPLPPPYNVPGARQGTFVENYQTLSVTLPGFYLMADIGTAQLGTIWSDGNPDPKIRSAAICMGWCYEMGSHRYQIDSADLSKLVHSQSAGGTPKVEALSGTYCILSYDHQTASLWICTDLWAQQSFYYGSTDKLAVASSRASVVADLLGCEIDGISYISLLRGTDFPPGRTLFANVWRATCGRALQFNIKKRQAIITQLESLFQPIERIGFGEAAARFTDVLTRVVPLAVGPPNGCVDLTGGNDTRMTAAALAVPQNIEVGRQAIFRVVGSKTNPDCRTAQKIADIMSWRLERRDRTLSVEYSFEALRQASVLSDGKFWLPLVLIRLEREGKMPPSSKRLVASLAGELFRDFCWRHEFYNLGRTTRINYDAMLKHRLWASNAAPIERVSNGMLSIADHNSFLLQPYQDAEKLLPDVKNVYKLDCFYHYKKFHSSYVWTISDYRAMAFPYHSREIAQVAMTIPWHLRLGRRLMTTGIQQMAPHLAAIPSDKGAPMQPLRLYNIPQYAKWMFTDAKLAYVRHFSKRKFTPPRPVPTSLEPLCLEIVGQSRYARFLYDSKPFIDDILHRNGKGLSKIEYWEAQALLLVEMLLHAYPGISHSFSFTSHDAKIASSIVNL